MIGLVRAATLCATLVLASLRHGMQADGQLLAFKRDESGRSEQIKLEAQIKKRSRTGDAKSQGQRLQRTGTPTRTPSNAAISGPACKSLGQIAATAPEDSAELAETAPAPFSRSSHSNSTEETFLLERASTAAYIAYQRAGNPVEESDALAVLGHALSERKLWRPALDALRLSLDMREVADVRGSYEKMRDEHGFRLNMDYTVDSDSASARACFQFSEDLAKADSISRRSWHWQRAATNRRCRQRESNSGVDGLKHGERYNINLPAPACCVHRQGNPAEIG